MPATAVILYSQTPPMAHFIFFSVFANKILVLSLGYTRKKDRYLCTLMKLDRVV